MKIHLKDKGKIKKFQTCKYWSGDPHKSKCYKNYFRTIKWKPIYRQKIKSNIKEFCGHPGKDSTAETLTLNSSVAKAPRQQL